MAVAALLSLTARQAALADLPDRGDGHLLFDVGTTFALDDPTTLLFSAGIDLLRTDGDGHEKTVFLGLQFTF